MCSKCPPPERVHSSERLLHTRPTFSENVTISVVVSKLGCRELFFVEPGVKINNVCYCDVLLMHKLLPVIREISGNEFMFQQDSAPAHCARETLSSMRRTLFYRNSGHWTVQILTQWIQNLGYNVAARVPKIRNVDELRQCLLNVYSSTEKDVIDASIDQWRVRLIACVRSRGRHFEHML